MKKTIFTIIILLIIAACGVAVIRYLFLTPSAMKKNVCIAIFALHRVIPGHPDEYIIPPETLESLIVELKGKGYRPITVKQLLKAFNENGHLPHRPAMLTFDDGYFDRYSRSK